MPLSSRFVKFPDFSMCSRWASTPMTVKCIFGKATGSVDHRQQNTASQRDNQNTDFQTIAFSTMNALSHTQQTRRYYTELHESRYKPSGNDW